MNDKMSKRKAVLNHSGQIGETWRRSNFEVDGLCKQGAGFFRCALASLYEGLSVHPSVRPSVGPSVRGSVSINEKRGLGASYVGYPALYKVILSDQH